MRVAEPAAGLFVLRSPSGTRWSVARLRAAPFQAIDRECDSVTLGDIISPDVKKITLYQKSRLK